MSFNARNWELRVEFLDGHLMTEFGEIYLKENVIEVRSRDMQLDYGDNAGLITGFPLSNIRKYTISIVDEAATDEIHHDDTMAMDRR